MEGFLAAISQRGVPIKDLLGGGEGEKKKKKEKEKKEKEGRSAID